MPVPAGSSPEEAWEEITTLGKLYRKAPDAGLTWTVMECAGGDDCRCQFVFRSPLLWRRFHNDRLVEATLFGVPIPKVLLRAAGSVPRPT